MPYPRIPNFQTLAEQLAYMAQLKAEHGAKGIVAVRKDIGFHPHTFSGRALD